MLRRLLPLAQQAAQDFKQFRDGGYERADGVQRMAQPALKLAEESKKTLTELKRLATVGGPGARNQDEDSFVGRGMRDLLAVMDNAAYAHYLQSQLDSDHLIKKRPLRPNRGAFPQNSYPFITEVLLLA